MVSQHCCGTGPHGNATAGLIAGASMKFLRVQGANENSTQNWGSARVTCSIYVGRNVRISVQLIRVDDTCEK